MLASGNTIDILVRVIDQASGKFKEVASGFDDTAKKMKGAGTKMTAAVTAPIVGMGVAIVKTGMDYEAQMARVTAISGATGKDLESLENIAREMGRGTSFSATEAAKGLEYLAMAGWEVDAAVEGLPAVLRMAEATQMDLGRASDIVSDMMTAFQMEATEASRATDVLAATATSANTNVEMLGETMKYAAPAAAAAGWEIEETAAMAGKLADAGIKGSVAGTTLNMTIQDLQKNSHELASGVHGFSAEVYDSEGNMRSAVDILRDMENGMEGWTMEQKNAALANIFNQRSLRGVNILLGQGVDGLEEFTNELKNSEGAVDEMGEGIRDTLGYQLKELQAAVESAMIAFSEVLVPILREHVIPAIKAVAEWFEGLSEGQKKFVVGIAAVVAAIGPLLIVIGMILPAINAIIAIGAVMFIKIIAIIALIGLLVAAILWLIENWDNIKRGAVIFWEKIKETFQKGIDWLKDNFLYFLGPFGLIKVIIDNWDAIRDFFVNIWEKIKEIFYKAVLWIYDKTIGKMKRDWEVLKWAVQEVGKWFVGFWERLKNTFKSATDWIYDNTIGRLIKAFNRLKDVAGGVMDGISNIGGGIWSGVKGLVNLQEGGIVTSPRVVRLGEGGAEAVIPLGKGMAGIGGGQVINVYVQGGNYLDRDATRMFGEGLAKEIRKQLRQI